MDILFEPPLAFLIYMALVSVLVGFGRLLAGQPSSSVSKSGLYASGEASPDPKDRSAPGYRPFFVTALFFAVLHLGVLIVATSDLSAISVVYICGLIIVLIALILG